MSDFGEPFACGTDTFDSNRVLESFGRNSLAGSHSISQRNGVSRYVGAVVIEVDGLQSSS